MASSHRNRIAGRAVGVAVATTPILVIGAHADDAAAKTLTVASKKAHGKGTLRKALKQANRNEGRDRVVFRSRLSGKVKLRGKVKITGPLKIAGPGRRGPVVRGGTGGTTILFQPPYHTKYRSTKLEIRDLSLERVSLAADGSNPTDLRVIDSRLSGGGIHSPGIANDGNYGGADLRIKGSRIQGFDRTGVTIDSNYGDARIERSTIRANTAGVSLFKAHATIKNSTISGNSPNGGILVTYYASVGVDKSTISGNRTENSGDLVGSGGGIDAYYESFAGISNSTISGNSADGPDSVGGGIYGSASVTSSTITGNSAERGGGIFSAPDNYGTDGVSVTDSIVAGNQAPSGPECDGRTGFGPPESKGGNVFGADGCATPTATDLLTGRPLLGPLADNGGPTRTHELLAGSPALAHAMGTELKTDQRGIRRGKHPDSGSFERR